MPNTLEVNYLIAEEREKSLRADVFGVSNEDEKIIYLCEGKKPDTFKLIKINIVVEVSQMTKQSFTVLIEKDEDGFFIGTVPSLKGCYSYGKTLGELMANLKEAIEAHIETFWSEEKELPVTRFAGVQELEVEV